MKYIYKYSLLAVFITLLYCVLGCASISKLPTETKTLMGYEGIGAVLKTAKPILMSFCYDGTLNPDDCVKARSAYNEAVSIYKFLGDIAMVVMDTGDDSSYQMMSVRLVTLITRIQNYAGES